MGAFFCYNITMKLIVGLGNPGNQYHFTRHNFGFLALDFYAKIKNLSWEKSPKFNAIWLKSGDTIFIKPQSFYNDSGKSTREFSNYYKIDPNQIFVLCDDFTLPFGVTRFREKGSAGGNNGLKSTIAALKTTEFPRLRLGSANDQLRQRLGDTDFVLGRFTESERAQLPNILREITKRLDQFIS